MMGLHDGTRRGDAAQREGWNPRRTPYHIPRDPATFVGWAYALTRELTRSEYAEIRELEGIKPAPEVAQEFRIRASRVREIWDGLERGPR